MLGQLGGYPFDDQDTLDIIAVPGAPAMLPLSSSASAPPPASSSSQTGYRTPREYISLADDTCSYISPSGEACGRSADIQHWATTHALGEVKAMLDDDLVMGSVIKTPAAFMVAVQHLLFCRLCGALITSRWQLKRHVTTCFPGEPRGQRQRTLADAERIVEPWMRGVDGPTALVRKLVHLEDGWKLNKM